MLTDVKPGDFIRSVKTSNIFKVTEVSNQWGWFKVDIYTGKTRTYKMTPKGNVYFTKLTREELADIILFREMIGVTDYWREYD